MRHQKHSAERSRRRLNKRIAAVQMWVIYERPVDYPDLYVVRQQSVSGGGILNGDANLFETLEEAREYAAQSGKVRLCRSPEDMPCVLEVWI